MVASSDKPGSSGAENLESRQISPLGQAIRYFREDQRLTQEALADLAKVDKQRISDIERGETRRLHAPTVKKICDGLAISLDEVRAKEREFSIVADLGGAQRTEPHPDSPPAALVHNDIRPVPGFTGREDLLAGIDAALWHKGGGDGRADE
jgi:transcriptional regulator with XRE-family HTH domain